MQNKTKLGIIAFALMAFAITSTAYTAYYTDEASALAALGQTISIVPEKCKVIEITKTIETGKIGEAKIVATFEQPYYVNGQYSRRTGSIILLDDRQATAETEIAKGCDSLWATIQSEESKTIDKTIVEYTKGALSEITTKAYDVIKRAWETTNTIGG